MNLDGCSALITGASSGIGRELASQLAGRARNLVLIARRHERLEQLREELSVRHPESVIHTRRVDLTDRHQIEDLVRWLEQEKVAIDFLVNNAGVGDLGPFATSDPERNWQILLVNMAALTALTREFLPQMIARKRGAILNVSSSAGFIPIPGFAVYAATKAYVNSFSEALRAELGCKGITVTALCPGPVETEFTSVAHRAGSEGEKSGPGFVRVPVAKVARNAIAAVEHDRPLYIPGAMIKIAMALARATPMPVLRLVARITAKSG